MQANAKLRKLDFPIVYIKGVGKKDHNRDGFSRRAALCRLMGPVAAAGALFGGAPFARPADEAGSPDLGLPPKPLSPEDDAFLEELERANFQFFWEQGDQETGLVKDRFNVRGTDHTTVSNIAATGFGLTALCIGQKRGYVPLKDARDRVLATLRFLAKKMPHHRGFFYHWVDVKTGQRTWDSELSSIDTAMLLCGVLTCRQHFKYAEITRLAYQIFNRVEWTWLSEDTILLPHGWKNEAHWIDDLNIDRIT